MCPFIALCIPNLQPPVTGVFGYAKDILWVILLPDCVKPRARRIQLCDFQQLIICDLEVG